MSSVRRLTVFSGNVIIRLYIRVEGIGPPKCFLRFLCPWVTVVQSR